MRALIVKILAVALIVMGMNALTRQSFSDYCWGTEQFQLRRSWIIKHKARYNTLFFGSSQTKNHIIPPRFDSLAGSGIRSYNMGIVALTNPELYYLSGKMIREDSLRLRFAFIELHELTSFNEEKQGMVRFHYWMNASNYFSSIRSVMNEGFPQEKLEEIKKFTLHFLRYFFNIDVTYNYLVQREKKVFAYKPVGREGFVEAAKMKEEDKKEYREKIFSMKSQLEQFYVNEPVLPEPNKEEVRKIFNLISQFEQQGTYLIFILNPRQDAENQLERLALFHSIPAKHRIDLSDPFIYPEFYTLEYSANLNHMNHKGAEIFTDRLAEKFLELVAGNPDRQPNLY